MSRLLAGLCAAVFVCGCGGEEPMDAAAGRTSEPTGTPTTAEPTRETETEVQSVTVAIDPAEWCRAWWEQVVESDNPNSAAGSVMLLVESGMGVDDGVIASRSEWLDPYGGEGTEAEIKQAIEDINLACAIYITTGD